MLKVAIILVSSYLTLLLLMVVFQNKLKFHPDRQNFQICPAMTDRGAEAIEAKIEPTPPSEAGAAPNLDRLRFYLKGTPGARGWLVLFHGNSGSACDRANYLDGLGHLPFHFVFAEYPGFAADSTSPSGPTILANALALVQHIGDMNNENLPIYLLGESLGTGPATYVASKLQIGGLVLHTPFPSLSAVGQSHYPFIPVQWLIRGDFKAQKWANQVQCPVLVLHGTEDRTIPFRLGQEQSASFKTQTKLIKIQGAGHHDLRDHDPDLYWGSIGDFLKALPNT